MFPQTLGNLEAQPNLKIENEITKNLFYFIRKEKQKRVQTPWLMMLGMLGTL